MSETTWGRFVLFSGDTYYPVGGMDDFTSAHDLLDQAMQVGAECIEQGRDWAHVLDTVTGQTHHCYLMQQGDGE